jgi:hypothetical protein
MTSKYKMFKNFLHNEMEISKEDIQDWVKEAVISEVEKKISQLVQSRGVQNRISDTIKHELNYGALRNTLASQLASKLYISLDESKEVKSGS